MGSPRQAIPGVRPPGSRRPPVREDGRRTPLDRRRQDGGHGRATPHGWNMTFDRTVLARLGRATTMAALLGLSGCSSHSSTPVAPPVLIPLSNLTVAPHTDTLATGGTTQIVATAYDTLGAVVGNVAITWTSSDNAVCTVSGNGVVTAHAEGSAWVRAESSGKRDSASIFVRS